jgi:hypothetical protein
MFMGSAFTTLMFIIFGVGREDPVHVDSCTCGHKWYQHAEVLYGDGSTKRMRCYINQCDCRIYVKA